MSEWLLFNVNSSIFRLYYGETKSIFNELMMRSLCSRPTRLLELIVLAHWNNSRRVDMSLHSDTIFWFRATQSLLVLLNVACLAEKQQLPILSFLVWPHWGSNPWATALEASTLAITPLMRFYYKDILINIRRFR